MLPLGKLLLGASLVGAVPAVALTSPSFFPSFFSDKTTTEAINPNLPEWLKELNDKCYVIPTDNSDQNQAKLLVCANSDTYSSTNDLYFLYGHKNNQTNLRVLTATKNKEESQIKVLLEGTEGSLETQREEVNMKVRDQDWKDITETITLSTYCSLISYAENNSLSCNLGLSGNQPKTIPLTKFVIE